MTGYAVSVDVSRIYTTDPEKVLEIKLYIYVSTLITLIAGIISHERLRLYSIIVVVDIYFCPMVLSFPRKRENGRKPFCNAAACAELGLFRISIAFQRRCAVAKRSCIDE